MSDKSRSRLVLFSSRFVVLYFVIAIIALAIFFYYYPIFLLIPLLFAFLFDVCHTKPVNGSGFVSVQYDTCPQCHGAMSSSEGERFCPRCINSENCYTDE